MRTTVGQLLVNRTLPEDMRDYGRTLDKKTMKKLLSEIAQKYPDEYRQISHELAQIGHDAAYTSGGNSFGLKHMLKAKAARVMQQQLRQELQEVMADDSLTDDQRDQKIVLTVGKYSTKMQKAVFDESLAEGNPLARQVSSGSRGNPMNLASLRGSDLLYTDHRDRVLPIPVLRSYSEGLSPLEYWAGTYGARKGVIDTKFATQDAGFLSKQLNQIAHRLMITGMDAEKESSTLRGFPVDTSDEDSEGSLLAFDAGGYKRNTVLTPKILDDLNRKGVKRILVRSPAVGGPADGGVYARDAGVREFGRLPVGGENVGVTAAQAISEPLSQAQLSSKHAGGVAGATASQAVSGFDYINQLVQVPKQFKGGAAHSDVDGLVQRIEDGPAGGKYVWIENQKHFIGKDFNPLVQRGDKVEAGDVISEGIPNPAIIVKHKGVGEGRRYFINAFRQAFRDAGITANRRNIELLSRGLINHVRLQDEVGDYAPDDVIPYSQLEASWKPRPGYQTVTPKQAVGRYLERPYLHYSVGDKVRPSMLRDLDEFGIREIDVHEEEPPFQAEMVRGMSSLQHDPDWVTRMFGSGQKSSVLSAVHRGGTSDMTGTSFVPGLAHGVNFGQVGKIQTPQTASTKIGQFSQAAALLLEKQAQEPMSQQDAVRADQVRAIEHILDRINQRNNYWRAAREQTQGELYGKVDPTTGKRVHDVVQGAKWFLPGSWPLMFTSGSYAPITDEYGNVWSDEETKQYYQSARQNLEDQGYPYVSSGGINELYPINEPDKYPFLRSLTLPEEGLPDLYAVARATGAENPRARSGMHPPPNMTPQERQDWLKFMDKIVRPDSPDSWFAGQQYSPHGFQIMNTLENLYPEAYQEAHSNYWNPGKVWESMTPYERSDWLKQQYESAGAEDPAPHRSWESLGAGDTMPRAYTQLYPEWYDQQVQAAREMAMSQDPNTAMQGTKQYWDLVLPDIAGPEINRDTGAMSNLFEQELKQLGAQSYGRPDQILWDRLHSAYSRGDITEAEAQRILEEYRPVMQAHLQAAIPGYQPPQQQPQQQPQPQPQQPMPGPVASQPAPQQPAPQQPQQPQPIQPPTQRPPTQQAGRDAQGRSGFYANLPHVPRPQPQQPQQPQQPMTSLAPDARLLARQWQQPSAGPVPQMLQAGMQANPEGMRQMMGSSGAAGVGAFGLMMAPKAMMGLLRGPDSRQNVTLPKTPQAPQTPKLPKPKPIEPPKPPKPPGAGGTDMVPG